MRIVVPQGAMCWVTDLYKYIKSYIVHPNSSSHTTMSSSVQYVVSGDGTKIWAESAGDRSKPALVLIHGFGCTALGFEKQFSDTVLLESLHLIRYEMRGHGRSDKPITPEAYESIRFAQDFQAVCQAFGATRPFVLGWYVAVELFTIILLIMYDICRSLGGMFHKLAHSIIRLTQLDS